MRSRLLGARNLILASASPRRRELLSALGVAFDVIPGAVEELFDAGMPAHQIAHDLALAKALAVARSHREAVVLAADTLVVLGEGPHETILGKPETDDEAQRMLRMLSGVTHRVITGVAVVWSESPGDVPGVDADALDGRRHRVEVVTTRVRFRCLDDSEIARYVASGEPMDKAGAYGIQGGAASFVEKIEGDYYNVVGLSLRTAAALLDGLVRVPGRAPDPPPTPFPIVP